MRTKDIEKLGIDRNFLKACYKKGHEIIKPKRIPCKDTYNENYYPCEYSQEDIEIIWNAYLCRKIGLSFKEIKDLNEGKEVKIRESLASIIQKKEEEIAELQAIVEFIKYIKGIGIAYMPSLPEQPLGSKSFGDYLKEYICYLDGDKKLKGLLGVVDKFASVSSIEEITDEQLKNFELYCVNNVPNYGSESSNKLANKLYKLKDMLSYKADSKEVQDVICELYEYKKNIGGEDFTAWDFGINYYFLLDESSDLSKMYENMLGKEAFDLLKNGLLEFLAIECPERINRICD